MKSDEPLVTINGERLSAAQAMTLRVALAHFAAALRDTGLGDDGLGRTTTYAYLCRADEVEALMLAQTE